MSVSSRSAHALSLLRGVIFASGVALTVSTLYFAYALPMSRLRFSNLFLGMGLFLFYMREIEEAIDDSGETVADPAGKGKTRFDR